MKLYRIAINRTACEWSFHVDSQSAIEIDRDVLASRELAERRGARSSLFFFSSFSHISFSLPGGGLSN